MDANAYVIRIKGHLDERWFEWFAGLTIDHTAEGETMIDAALDQAALHAILARIRDVGLELISVQKRGELS